MNFSENLRSLRRNRGVSQEKLAEFLGISFQAVSKWERGETMPDISLLPSISRFFGVSVDELLCGTKPDNERLYTDFERRAEELFRAGDRGENHLKIWQEAYQNLPNDPRVREHLMSAYFDADKVKYVSEISELAQEFYFSDCDSLFKCQAIRLAAVSKAESGDPANAEKWVSRAGYAMHSRECVGAEIHAGEELLRDVRFFVFHALERLFYMTVKLSRDGILSRSESLEAVESVIAIFENIYKNDDAGFETLRQIFNLHGLAADFSDDEDAARLHLERACELSMKMQNVCGHMLKNPLLKGLEAKETPGDGLDPARFMLVDMMNSEREKWRGRAWFEKITEKLGGAVNI